jgi:2-polyprenyl-3-methyl-5-hydroxy-6-metoxy-1,4-benzoquinol methylase
MKRASGQLELLDGPLNADALDGNLHDLARVNRWLGGTALSERAIAPFEMGTFVLTILDIGTGGADIPIRLMRKGRAITATDIRPEIVRAAQRNVGGRGITVREGRIESEKTGSFDIAHASMVIHHLEPAETVTFLREMGRVARQAVVINDLNRGWRWLLGAKAMTRTLTRSEYTRNDAPLSVRRAYTIPEVVDMARQAGLRPVAKYTTRPAYRYALVFVRDSGD